MSARQPGLFDAPATLPPRARRTDPEGSRAAATAMRESGKLARQAAQVLALVERAPGRTSRQLSELGGVFLDRYQIARRLADLWHLERVYCQCPKHADDREHWAGGECQWWPGAAPCDR